jgi:hypothetical protein
MDPLVTLIIGGGVELSLPHDNLVITAQDLAYQEEILFERICKTAQSVYKIPVETIGYIQSESVNLKVLHPIADGIENMPDHLLIAEIEFDQVIISFPTLIPQTVIIV